MLFKRLLTKKKAADTAADPPKPPPKSPGMMSLMFKKDGARLALPATPPPQIKVMLPEPATAPAGPDVGSVTSQMGDLAVGRPPMPKRVSTIVEGDDLNYSDDTDLVSEDETDDDEGLQPHSRHRRRLLARCSEAEDSDDDEHCHAIRQLPCKLEKFRLSSAGQQANEEAKHTYSLLGSLLKIHPFLAHFNHYELVIDDRQLELVNELKKRLHLACTGDIPLACLERTLHGRYGVVTQVIGRGAYGVIKIVDPEPEKKPKDVFSGRYYAVKELTKRKDEENTKYIDRVMLEFIAACRMSNKHIVKHVDLMVERRKTGPVLLAVMEASTGGDLFSYLTTVKDNEGAVVAHMLLTEIDCFVKQIAKGLFYMHQHGVAHCDLKLENILVHYKDIEGSLASIILRLGDFGKANVLRTSWDKEEHLFELMAGPLGLEPYMAPEAHRRDPSHQYLLVQTDNWALGVVTLVLFNLRRHYYLGHGQTASSDGHIVGSLTHLMYCWRTTALKVLTISGHLKARDKVYGDYINQRMVADYDNHTKEWLVKRLGKFGPIERLFSHGGGSTDSVDESSDGELAEDLDDLGEIRRWCLYKLLDTNPATRMTASQLLKSDWMGSIDLCF